MILKTPFILDNVQAKCDVRGFTLCPGDMVMPGDYLAELRYEVIEEQFSDCPIVHYGDLVATGSGAVRSVGNQRCGAMGMFLAEIGDEEGDFPVNFVCF